MEIEHDKARLSPSMVMEMIKLCKTTFHFRQLHAQTVTTTSSSFCHLHFFLTALLRYGCTIIHQKNTPLLSYALTLFSHIPTPTTFCYNLLIRLHTTTPSSALLLFIKMRRCSIPPDSHTFPFTLKALSHLPTLSPSSSIHADAIKFGLIYDLFLQNSLTHAYCASHQLQSCCTLLEEAIFKDVVSHNILLYGLAKGGYIAKARILFETMKDKDAVSWGTLVGGYTRLSLNKEAMHIFRRMLSSGFIPDVKTLVSAIAACTQMGDLLMGKVVHGILEKRMEGFVTRNKFVCTALVDFYCKCGYVGKAERVFEGCMDKNVYVWNAMIFGLAMHGRGREMMECFRRMVKEGGVEPDGVSLMGVLVGCSHAGMVEEGRAVFLEMEDVYGVRRGVEHYGCMVDMLGRGGMVKEAVEMVKRMPMGGDVFVYGGLLNGCRIYGDVETAEWAAEKAVGVMAGEEVREDGVVNVISGVYAENDKWREVVKMRKWREGFKLRDGSTATEVFNYCGRSLVETFG